MIKLEVIARIPMKSRDEAIPQAYHTPHIACPSLDPETKKSLSLRLFFY